MQKYIYLGTREPGDILFDGAVKYEDGGDGRDVLTMKRDKRPLH